MVVAQFIDSLKPGGSEVVAVNLANALAEQEALEVHLLVGRDSGALVNRVQPRVRIFFLNKKGPFDPLALVRLYRYLRKNRIALIHAHSSSFLYPALIKKFLGFKLVWHDHDGTKIKPNGYRPYPYKTFSGSFDYVLCVSPQLLDNNLQYLKTNKERVIFFPNYSNALPVTPEETVTPPPGRKKMVICANLRPQKDHQNLLRALHSILPTAPPFLIYCVGAINDGPYKDMIMSELEELGLQDYVYFTGEQPNPFVFLMGADVAILSSESEGLPLSLIEYGLAGCPVVCTDVGACGSIVNESTGWLVPPCNPKDLGLAILEALTNPEKARLKGQKLHQLILKEYSREAIVRRLLDIYRMLINKR